MDGWFDLRSPSSRLVLTAVLETLVIVGYEGVTVAEIKTRAGAAGAALRDTPDVDSLIIAALERVQLLDVPTPTGSLRGDLLALLRPWRGPRGRDERVLAAVLSAAERRPRLQAAVAEALDRPIAQAVGVVLSRAMAGAAPPERVQTLSWILRGLVLERLRTGARSAVDLQELVDFLLAGAADRPGRHPTPRSSR